MCTDLCYVAYLEQAVDASKLLQIALIKNCNSVADILDIRQKVAAHHHGLALRLKLENQVLHLTSSDRIEARCRFVENNQLGIVNQRLSQSNTTRHSLAVFLQLPALRPIEADHVDQFFNPLFPLSGRHVKQTTIEIEGFLSIEKLIEVGLFGEIANAFVLRDITRLFPKDERLATGWKQETENQLDGRRFAGTVRSK